MSKKRILSVILALSMILTMAPFSFTGTAADISIGGETTPVNKASSLELVRPNATVEVTPVTRVCHSLSDPYKEASNASSVIIAATPSGIPKNSSRFSSALYAGETPVSTTIRFAPGCTIDESTLNITCSNATVQLEGPVSNMGTYTWTVKDGTPAAIGEVLTFNVTYKYVYTDSQTGKTYNSDKLFTTTGYSYVDSVLSPAGMYTHRRTYISYVFGSDNVNRSYVATYLLGAGVYSNSTTTGGVDWNTGSGSDNLTYGKMFYNSSSGTDKYNSPGYKADSNRPVSTIYYDTDRGSTLASQNIRFVCLLPQQSDEDDQKTSNKLAEVRECIGNLQTFDDSEDDSINVSTNTTDLGVTITSQASTGVSTVGGWFNIPFAGTGPSGDNQTYTVVLDVQTPGYWSGVHTFHSHTLTIVKVNKGGLREKLMSVVNSEPSGPRVTDDATGKGYNPQSWYYSYGWGEYSVAYAEAQKVVNNPKATSAEISDSLRVLTSAYDRLTLASADYTNIDYYYNHAKELKSVNYDPASWAALQTALAEYQTGYSILYQPELDKICNDIKYAIEHLIPADADYTLVDEKVDIINGLMQDVIYEYDMTAEEFYSNWNVVVTALTNCGYYYDEDSEAYILDPEKAKTKAEQSTVDTYPVALQAAINTLKINTADYTALRQALSAYTTFKNTIAPYITDESYSIINSAYNEMYSLYSPPLTLERQSDIDDAVDYFNEVIEEYEYRDADYTEADAAAQRYNALDRSIYTDLSEVDEAYNDLLGVYGLDARYQQTVDEATAELNTAINNLTKKGANYAAVDAAIAAVQAENQRVSDTYGYAGSNFYKNWNTVQNAVNAVVRGLDITKQSQVDGYASAINSALAGLIEKEADYTAVERSVSTANGYLTEGVVEKYTDESVNNLRNAINAVVYGKKISQQSVVDGYNTAITNAINALAFKGADYSAVDAAIATANEKISMSAAYEQAHNGYPYYTADSIAALNSKIDAVVRGLDATKQTQVNNYASAINTAISGLVIAPADYTAVEQAKAAVPADLSIYTTTSKTKLNQALAYNKNLKADKQSTVDGFATAIYAGIAALVPKGIDVTGYNRAKATIPADLTVYTDASVAAVNNQLSAIDAFLATNPNITQQSELDSMVAVLSTAIADLELKPVAADYTLVDAAISAVADYEPEKDFYTNYSAVENAVAAVVRGLTVNEQARVDGFATAINNAIAALTLKGADYTAVDAAKAAANDKAAEKDLYTNFDAVEAAVAAVVTGKNIKEQSTVDGYAKAINDAVDALAYKPADYTAVDAAKAAADDKAAEKDLYKNFDAVEAAVAAVVTDKNIKEQAAVDAMADAINDAITALEYKDIDTTAYDAKVAEFGELEKAIYTDDSVAAVEAAITAGDNFLAQDGLTIKDQADLDALTADLAEAIDALELKKADYTALEAKIAEFYTKDEDLYTNYFDQWMIVSDVESWLAENGNLPEKDQGLVDEQTAIVAKAIDDLEPIATEPTAYFQAKEGSTTVINTKTMTITGLKTDLSNKELLTEFLDYDGVTVKAQKANSSAKYLGTGSTVTVTWADGKVDVYTIIIYGDVDGNGLVDGTDVSTTSSYVDGITTLTSIQQRAANVDGMRNVLSTDAVAILEVVSSGKSFDQVNPVIING